MKIKVIVVVRLMSKIRTILKINPQLLKIELIYKIMIKANLFRSSK